MVEIQYNKSYTRAYRAMPRVRLHIDDSWSFEMGPIMLDIVRDSDLFDLAADIKKKKVLLFADCNIS